MPASKRARLAIQHGDLRKPVHILQRVDAQDAAGGETTTYTDVFGAPVWCMDEQKKSRVYDQGGKLVAATWHQYTVRWTATITSGMYIQDPDYPVLLYIQGTTDPDGQKHWLQLTAEDVEDSSG